MRAITLHARLFVARMPPTSRSPTWAKSQFFKLCLEDSNLATKILVHLKIAFFVRKSHTFSFELLLVLP